MTKGYSQEHFVIKLRRMRNELGYEKKKGVHLDEHNYKLFVEFM
jgi:hypothetical protein